MMWSEFIEGTGCKDTQHNYEVFRNLEILYTNSEMTKAQIYEYGKKLVDNSKTEQETEVEGVIRDTIKILRNSVNWSQFEIRQYAGFLLKECTPADTKYYQARIDEEKTRIKDLESRIRLLRASID